MAYVPGTYLKELKEAHQRGEHVEDEHPDCQPCNFEVVPEGFSSIDEFADAVMEGACELQVFVDAHDRGEHQGKYVGECIQCVYEKREE